MTLVGPTLVARSALTIALAGADLGARIRAGRRLAPGRSHRLGGRRRPRDARRRSRRRVGRKSRLSRRFRRRRGAGRARVPFDVPCRRVRRPRRPGAPGGRRDRCRVAASRPPPARAGLADRRRRHRRQPRGRRQPRRTGPRPVRGPPRPARAGSGPRRPRHEGPWRVGSAADRVGIRLDGDPLAGRRRRRDRSLRAFPGARSRCRRTAARSSSGPTTRRPAAIASSASSSRPIGPSSASFGPARRSGSWRRIRQAALAALQARGEALATGAAALREAAGWDAPDRRRGQLSDDSRHPNVIR